jgi:CDP-2,3-bis-(O-geranylgeranyl)-sn-glycerol synthase
MPRSAAHLARVAWLILPVILAGLGHVAVLKTRLIPRLAWPLDGGRQWGGRPLYGPNKTWRGLLVMTALTGWLTLLQAAVERRLPEPGVTSGYRLPPWLAGSLMGLTYCLAELPNSFVKRRLGIPPGGRWTAHGRTQYIVDQIDSVAGCVAALRLLYRAQPGDLSRAFLLGAAAHIGVDQLLYAIGVKTRGR